MQGLVILALAALFSVGLTGCHTIDTKAMPQTYVGLGVWMPMRSTGGEGPLTWSATGLPPGLAIHPTTGVISGTPTTAGQYSVAVSAVDPAAHGATATTTYPMEVSEPAPVDLVEPSGSTYDPYNAVISDDGRYVAYWTADPAYRPNGPEIGFAYVLLDRTTGSRSVVFADDGRYSDRISISGDGRFVAFTDNPPDFGGPGRVGVWDRVSGTTEFIPDVTGATTFLGAFSPVVSDDGRFVAYIVAPGSFGQIFLYDRTAGTTAPVTPLPVQMEAAALSGDGSTVAFATPTAGVIDGDDNGRCDVFLWHRATGSIERITDNQLGDVDFVGPMPSLSSDGASMTFVADIAGPHAPISFVWDRATGTPTALPTPGYSAKISADGQRVLYTDWSTTVPAGGNRLVLWDRPTGSVRRTAGDPANHADLAGDGRHIVAGDGIFDPTYVWDLLD